MRNLRIHFALVAALAAAAAAACSPAAPPAVVEPAPERAAAAVVPAAPSQAEPLDAVLSYLAWTSYAYRMADSGLASMVADPYEGVRIDSFIQLNREQGRAIEQTLVAHEQTALELTSEQTATVALHETWRYRYFALDTGRYVSPEYAIEYDTTYTVVAVPGGGRWVVESVVANSDAPPK